MQTNHKTKPLRRCRKMFSLFCSELIEKPLDENQMRSRKRFRFMVGVIVLATAFISNSSLLANRFATNDPDELFVDCYQFTVYVFEVTSLMMMSKLGPKLLPLFQNFDEIYQACKTCILQFQTSLRKMCLNCPLTDIGFQFPMNA